MLKLSDLDALPRLQHDAAIIDDDGNNLIVAVRLAKATIRDNHALMACLSDMAAEGPINARPFVFPAKAAPRVRNRAKLATAVLMGAVGLSALGALWATQTEAVPEPPLINQRVWIVNPIVAASEPLRVAFQSHRTRLCRTDVERTILTEKQQTVFSERQSGIGQAVTDAPIIREIQVKMPDGLKPGAYLYRSITYSDCGPKDQHALTSGDLSFQLR